MTYVFLTVEDEAFLAVLHALQRTSRVTPIDISVFANRLMLPMDSAVQIAQHLAERDLVTLQSIYAVTPTRFGAQVARTFGRQHRFNEFLRTLRIQHGRMR